MKRLLGLMGEAVLVGVCWWGIAGCDATTTADTVITISPADTVLTTSNRTAVFTASLASTNRTLVLPLIWTVGDGSLGAIKSSQGLSAVYESTGNLGNNTVIVRDQTYSEGMASVLQQ